MLHYAPFETSLTLSFQCSNDILAVLGASDQYCWLTQACQVFASPGYFPICNTVSGLV